MESVMFLVVGVAVFLIGMGMMTSGLKKATGNRIKKLFSKMENNRFAGLGIGAATTALIQSSSATSVMVIGFLNVGVMSIFQGLSVLMGAYIGTTVTGLLVSISSLSGATSIDISFYFMLLTLVGVICSFTSKNVVKHIGEIFSGLGLLFLGLYLLKSAFNSELINGFCQSLFLEISNPLLLLICGALVTMIVQSSSATTGIMIVMCATGAVSSSSALYVALGATIGTVFTTILASLGGTTNSKRLAFIAFIVRIVAAMLCLAIIWPLDYCFGVLNTMSSWFLTPSIFIAIFMVAYNVITMFALLPFIEKFEKLGQKIIKDKEVESLNKYIKFIDEKFINTPEVALMQVEKEIINMNQLAFDNYKRGFKAIVEQDLSLENEIIKTEDAIDYLNNKITDFLISLSSKVDYEQSRIIGGYFHAINDIERIGDHAQNFLDNAIKMKGLGINFSNEAIKELKELDDVVQQMFLLTFVNLDKPNETTVKEIHDLENKSDILKDQISTAHYKRITTGKCKVELSPFICTLVSELERVADHLTNVGYTYINPTGDDPIEKK